MCMEKAYECLVSHLYISPKFSHTYLVTLENWDPHYDFSYYEIIMKNNVWQHGKIVLESCTGRSAGFNIICFGLQTEVGVLYGHACGCQIRV